MIINGKEYNPTSEQKIELDRAKTEWESEVMALELPTDERMLDFKHRNAFDAIDRRYKNKILKILGIGQ